MSQIKKNVFLSSTAKILSTVLLFASGIVVARYLPPSDFGLIIMVTTVTSLADLFRNLGLSSALVQRSSVNQNMYSTIFWFNWGIGFLLFWIVFFISPLVSEFYNEPELTLFLRFVAGNFLISPLYIIQDVILRRQLDFSYLFICQISGTLASVILCVIMILSNYGIWSVILAQYGSTITSFFLVFFYVKWLPSLYFHWKYLIIIRNFGVNYTLQSFTNYGMRNLDNVLIGKFLGPTTLGFYNRAYQLMLLPMTQIVSGLNEVLFSTLSRVHNDNFEIRRVYLKTLSTVLFITYPIYGLAWTLSTEGIHLIYGANWINSGPIFDNLVIAAAAQTIITINATIFSIKNKMNLSFRIGLFMFFLTGVAFVFGVFVKNIQLLAIFYSVASFIVLFISLYYVNNLINIILTDLIRELTPSLIITIFSIIPIIPIKEILVNVNELHQFFVILISVICFITLHLFLWRVFMPNRLRENLNFLPDTLSQKVLRLLALNSNHDK